MAGQLARESVWAADPTGLTPVYLDHNATTPVEPRVIQAALPYWTEHFGNPSSDHLYGSEPLRALTEARRRVAQLIGAQSDEIVFAASGSEANLLALRGFALGDGTRSREPARLIVQATEHPSVLATARMLVEHHGCRLTILPVDGCGLVSPAALAEVLVAEPADRTLVSVMLANNETGTIQPIRELADLAHRAGAFVHTDAAQACAKIDVNVDALGVDLLTVVGHKMYAPRGVAALYRRRGSPSLEPVVYGGSQESGLRAGTENVALAVSLGVAATIASDDIRNGSPARVASLRDRLHSQLVEAVPGTLALNGSVVERLPNTLNVSIDGFDGNDLLARAPEIAASTGSACHTGARTPSPVLIAMGTPVGRALAAIRISLGRSTSEIDVERAVAALRRAVS